MTRARPIVPRALALAASLAAACSSTTPGGDSSPVDAAVPTPDLTPPPVTIPFACNNPGVAITDGNNQNWMVGTDARSFLVKLPSDTSKPVAVIFQWHGLGDTADNFENFMLQGGVSPDSDPDFPFILVTPESLKLQPIGSAKAGIEWDLFDATSATDNLDRAFFESMLGCLNTSFKIDGSRIYSVGFSAGAIMTDMLHSSYPALIGATYAASGAWFNDQKQSDNVMTGPLTKPVLSWPPLVSTDNGTILLSHGGAKDIYALLGITVISFEICAGFADTYLPANHRTVLDCPHTSGHMPDPKITPKMVIDFFKVHKAGQPSPYAKAGLPAALANVCSLKNF